MAEALEEVEIDHDDFGHQGCYIFKSSATNNHDIGDRPKKRRKATKHADKSTETWPQLCGGVEPKAVASLRERTFVATWTYVEEKIREVVDKVDDKVEEDVRTFIQTKTSSNGKLKTALVLSSRGGSTLSQTLQLREENLSPGTIIVRLHASQSTNLQTALKTIIRLAIEAHSDQEAYHLFLQKHKRMVPMQFDLDLLRRYVEAQALHEVIISIQDVETFDTAVLSELLSTLASWADRIPLITLLGIATTISLFEHRLSKSVVRLLEPTVFESRSNKDNFYEAFCCLQCDPKTQLSFGPAAISALFELIQDQSATTSAFIRAMKYIYMSHFFANPLSMLLERRLPDDADIGLLCEAIRNTTSFQDHCDDLLKQGKPRTETIRQLLSNDAFLLTQAQSAIISGIDSARRTNDRVRNLVVLHQHVTTTRDSSLHLHAQLLQHASRSSDLTDNDITQDLTAKLKALPSDDMISLIFEHAFILTKITGSNIDQLTKPIAKLHTKHSISRIRSTYDINPTTNAFALTNPSKSPSTNAGRKEYNTIIDDLLNKITSYFSSTTNNATPSTPFMSETYIYNSPHHLRNTFQPRARFAIERALSSPSDYLGCDCCSTHQYPQTSRDRAGVQEGEGGRENGRDATSILYNLTNEAGREINVRDLWDTFSHIMSPPPTSRPPSHNANDDDDANEDGDKIESDEQEKSLLTQFYTALANLKMLGMIKSSSTPGTGPKGRGVDVVCRSTWKGL